MLRAIPAVADEMRVGDLVRRPAAATVLDLPLELELDGLLSPWDYARDMDVVVDAAAHSLRLGVTRLSSVTRKTTGTGHILPLRWIEGSPRTAVDAGDRSPVPTSALLDSGAVVNLLCADLAAALHRTVDAAAQGIGAGGAVVLHQTRALPMRTGNAEARCLPVMVKRCAADPSALVDEPAGIVLGMPWFLNAPIGFPARRHVALQLPQCA